MSEIYTQKAAKQVIEELLKICTANSCGELKEVCSTACPFAFFCCEKAVYIDWLKNLNKESNE